MNADVVTAQQVATMFDAFDEVQQQLINAVHESKDPSVRKLREIQRDEYKQALGTLTSLLGLRGANLVDGMDCFGRIHRHIEVLVQLLTGLNQARSVATAARFEDAPLRRLLNEQFLETIAIRNSNDSTTIDLRTTELFNRLETFFSDESKVVSAQMLFTGQLMAGMHALRSAYPELDVRAAKVVHFITQMSMQAYTKSATHPLLTRKSSDPSQPSVSTST